MEDDLKVLITETGRIDSLDSKEVRPGCLGRLGGIIADWGNETRNGRLYTRELWVKVFETPWVKEALETRTLFGEADHPDERLESKLSLAAVVMTDYEFVEDQQILYGWFDILDTPSGRILRTLADYGSKLGVSSRGRGKIITRGGRQVVEESSYLFGGFDIVALPAVKKARQDFVAESVESGSISESIRDQINECKTPIELDAIREVLESAGIADLDEYISLIEEKSNELNPDNAIVEKLTGELQKSYSELNRVKSRRTHRAKSRIDAINEDMERMEKENVKLFSALYNENSQMKSELVLKDRKIKSLDEQLTELISEAKEQAESLSRQKESLDRKIQSVERLKSENKALKETVQSLKSDNKSLSLQSRTDARDYNALVNQYNELIEEVDQVSAAYERALERYLNLKCSQSSGLSPRQAHRLLPEDYTIDDIDRVVDDQVNLQRRMSQLPIYSPQLSEQRVLSSSGDANLDESYGNLKVLLNSMKHKKG